MDNVWTVEDDVMVAEIVPMDQMNRTALDSQLLDLQQLKSL